MGLRPATTDDVKLLFDWRNDPETRNNSIHIEEVKWDDHVRWLEESLANPKRRIFIAVESSDVSVGQIRLDEIDEAQVELSWTIAPEERGQGYGKEMVRLGVDKIPAGRTVVAKIKSHNEASRRIVIRLGFQLKTTQDGLEEWVLSRKG